MGLQPTYGNEKRNRRAFIDSKQVTECFFDGVARLLGVGAEERIWDWPDRDSRPVPADR
jgi:hypothetical protein